MCAPVTAPMTAPARGSDIHRHARHGSSGWTEIVPYTDGCWGRLESFVSLGTRPKGWDMVPFSIRSLRGVPWTACSWCYLMMWTPRLPQ